MTWFGVSGSQIRVRVKAIAVWHGSNSTSAFQLMNIAFHCCSLHNNFVVSSHIQVQDLNGFQNWNMVGDNDKLQWQTINLIVISQCSDCCVVCCSVRTPAPSANFLSGT